jgi:tRNA-Thr(GGU) m(6)t(6)A37 methyltransferase TsaA
MTADQVISCLAIGVVRSPFTTPQGTPIQASGAGSAKGAIEIFKDYRAGLADLEGFEYLIVLSHFHLVAAEKLLVTPFLDDTPRGVFATRAPTRPNRIGISVVRQTRLSDGVLEFEGCDMLEGSPVLDLKPYVPAFDVRVTDQVGWYPGDLASSMQMRADGRMVKR